MRWIFYAPTICKIRPQPYIDLKHICRAIKIVRSQSTVDLSHEIYGPTPTPDSEAIFLLHGVLGSKRNWQSMGEKIAAHTNKPVVAIDARNHGDSPHSEAHSYLDLAADVTQLLSKLSIKKSTVIGHSMGGRTAMVFALTEPSKAASLIVVDISPIIREDVRDIGYIAKVMDAMISVDFKGSDTMDKARAIAKDTIKQSQLFENERAAFFILMNIGKLADNSFGWKCNVNALRKNFENIASFPNMDGKTFDGPTLFIGGKKSNYLPPDDITGIRRLFPKANFLYIEGVGHNVHAEDPKAFFDTVVKFLA